MRVACPFADRRLAALLAALIVAGGLGGCLIGPSVASYEPARSARGVTATLQVVRNSHETITVAGELLEANGDGLLVLIENGPIARARYDQIRRAAFAQSGSFGLVGGRHPSAARLAQLRMLARFPYDRDSAMIDTLLARMGQTAPADAAARGLTPGIDADLAVAGNPGEPRGAVRGELVAVEEAALMLRTQAGAVVRVPYRCIADALFADIGMPGWVGTRRVPSAGERRKLAQRARYPEPPTTEELRRLLPEGVTEPTAIACPAGGVDRPL